MKDDRNDWSMAERFKRALGWEAKKLFYRLRIPAGIFLGVLVLIGLLPQAACDFLRNHVFAAVALINIGFVIAVGFGILLPVFLLISPYGDQMHPVKGLGDLSEKACLLARVALGAALLATVLLTGNLASVLMEKFATESMSWFHFNFTLGFCKMLVYAGAVMPLAILWIFLRRLGRHQERQYVRSVFWGVLLCEAVIRAAAELQLLHFAPGEEPPVWVMDGVWYLVMLGSAAVLFRRCLAQEQRPEKGSP